MGWRPSLGGLGWAIRGREIRGTDHCRVGIVVCRGIRFRRRVQLERMTTRLRLTNQICGDAKCDPSEVNEYAANLFFCQFAKGASEAFRRDTKYLMVVALQGDTSALQAQYDEVRKIEEETIKMVEQEARQLE